MMEAVQKKLLRAGRQHHLLGSTMKVQSCHFGTVTSFISLLASLGHDADPDATL
jgi:hypothetical protein